MALVDAFNFDDVLELHQTAIGRKDGKPYERLWEWSEKDPANNEGDNEKTGDMPPAYDEVWKPVYEYFRKRDKSSATMRSKL